MNSDLTATIAKHKEEEKILMNLAILAAMGGPGSDEARSEATRIMQGRLGKTNA